jgi:hypothetical protein
MRHFPKTGIFLRRHQEFLAIKPAGRSILTVVTSADPLEYVMPGSFVPEEMRRETWA